MIRRLLTALLGAVAVCAATLTVPAAALGHAAFVGSSPDAGQRVEATPRQVTLSFTEPLNVRLSSVEVVAVDGGELRGTPLVVNFWASWCDPCRTEAAVLERGWKRARERGVLFVGLNMQDVSQDARDFLREFELSFPNIRDPTNDTARAYGATGIPETFFISAKGKIVGHVIGTVSEVQLDRGVAAALSGRPQGADQGGEQRPSR